MKLIQTSIEKNFTVKYNDKTYYINYLNSDGHILGLANRYHWEIIDEEHEELNIYEFQSLTKKEKKHIEKNRKLFDELIEFCVNHFNDYKPKYKEEF